VTQALLFSSPPRRWADLELLQERYAADQRAFDAFRKEVAAQEGFLRAELEAESTRSRLLAQELASIQDRVRAALVPPCAPGQGGEEAK